MEFCNLCGKKLGEKDSFCTHTQKDGTKYILCADCETKGARLDGETKDYFICENCGTVYEAANFKNACKMCENKEKIKKISLTSAEIEFSDREPEKFYEEKLGTAAAKQIAEWKSGKERKKIMAQNKREQKTDAIFVSAIVIGYFMLDFAIRNFIGNKLAFISLLIPSFLEIATVPLFKAAEKRTRKKAFKIRTYIIAEAIFIAAYFAVLKLL